jgi:ligand-binding sensor domain-containing protein
MSPGGERWLDGEAGPVVRPYALTRGRTRPQGAVLDLIDVVACTGMAPDQRLWVSPEQGGILRLCRRPIAVADLASSLDLPLGVVRVLLSDLRQQGLITVLRPAARRQVPDISVMRDVLHGLQAL